MKVPGPGTYDQRGASLGSPEGKCTLSTKKNAIVCKFPGAIRPVSAVCTPRSAFDNTSTSTRRFTSHSRGLQSTKKTPGPGTYQIVSEFGKYQYWDPFVYRNGNYSSTMSAYDNRNTGGRNHKRALTIAQNMRPISAYAGTARPNTAGYQVIKR